MAHSLFNDIGFEMAVSQCLKASIVTSRQVHVEILNDFFRNIELNRRNARIQEHLTCIVPFLNDVPARELLMMRAGRWRSDRLSHVWSDKLSHWRTRVSGVFSFQGGFGFSE